jgi:SAM-dependent methyltransferase
MRIRWRIWLFSNSRAAVEARRWLYHGRRVRCPCCGTASRRYMADHLRRDARCRGCFSEERHRALRVFLEKWLRDNRPLRLLHFAPEPSLRSWLESFVGVDYVTADIGRPDVNAVVDMTDMGVRAEAFDAIIASHVLEHVADDRAALREVWRILRPGGTALVMVPLDASRSLTFEDPAITTPAARQAAYWQADHVRLYGRDFEDRLRAAGFDVTLVRPSLEMAADDVRRFGLAAHPAVYRRYRIAPPDEIYVACRPE